MICQVSAEKSEMYLGPKKYGNFKESHKAKNSSREHRKDKDHLAFIHRLPSVLGGSQNIVAHHLLSVPNTRGVGMKAPDCYTVPLTWNQHERLHHECGAKTEEQWFEDNGIVAIQKLAERIYANTGDLNACLIMIRHHTIERRQPTLGCPPAKQ